MFATTFPWRPILTTSLVWGVVFVVIFIYRKTPMPEPHDPGVVRHAENGLTQGTLLSNFKLASGCGTSPEEARNAGCQYDMLSNSWLPKACMDNDAVANYQSDGSWYSYLDRNHTKMLLTADEMGSVSGGIYYTSTRDHIVHCAALWRKQFRVFAEARTNFDTTVADEEHTMHCAQLLMDMTEYGPDFRSIPIEVVVGYGSCWVRN
jgi:hypothetical protein